MSQPLWLRVRPLRRRIAEGVEVPLGEAGERVEQALFLRAALVDLPAARGPYRAADGLVYRDERPIARTADPALAEELADLLNRQAADDAAQPRRRWPRPTG